MTSLSMRGLSCWSTTPAFVMPACGQTVSCTPTSVRRGQGALDSRPPLPSSPTSQGREEGRKSHVWPQTPGVGLMCRPMGSDGGLFPTGLADDYIPISAALSSLGTQEINQLKT